MPELRDRDDSEAAIAILIAQMFNDQRREIKTRLGDPPRISGISGSFWTGIERETASKLKPKLKEVYIASATALLADPGEPIEGTTGGLTAEAIDLKGEQYAEARSTELARQMTENTRTRVEKIARDNAGATAAVGLGVLLIGSLGAGRAEATAITEVTDAAARGELDTVAEFEIQTGQQVESIWNTERDGRVCPICRPLDRRPISEISLSELGPGASEVKPGINAHPRCRCHLTFEVAPELVGV